MVTGPDSINNDFFFFPLTTTFPALVGRNWVENLDLFFFEMQKSLCT